MIRSLVILYALLLSFFSLSAQNKLSFSGKVESIKGNAVPHAKLQILNTNIYAISDSLGHFEIKELNGGVYEVFISADGYRNTIESINLKSNFNTTVVLKDFGEQLDEIVVSAQKREENAQKLALSISALNAKEVQDYKLWNTKDLTAIVPNLYSANPGDNRNVTSIRGITSTSYDPAVTTYIDGVSQFGLDTYIAQLQDVERIEVLRGPQGTLYGRNAMGGVINIITKQPDNTIKGSVGADFGNYNLQRYSLRLSAPIVQNKLFFGLSGLYNKFNGYFKNKFNNNNFDDQHSFSGNYYLKYLNSSRLSFTLNIKHVANRNAGAFPLAGSIAEALEDPYTVNQNNTADMVDNIFDSSLSINYSGNTFNFSSQSTYQSNYRFYKQPIDADFSPLDFYAQVNDYGRSWNNVKIGTQEFRFSSPGSTLSRLKWVTGMYSFYKSSPTKLGLRFGSDASSIGVPEEMIGNTSINTNSASGFGIAFFTQANYAISNKLNLIAGMRYDYENKKLSVVEELEDANNEVVILDPLAVEKANFNAFTPKLALQYEVSPHNSIYGSYAKGFRAGGIDRNESAFFSFKPEYSNNFEVGLKNRFVDNHVGVNFSLFYTVVNNAQLPTLVLPEGLTVTRNVGKLRSKGAELELDLKLIKNLGIYYNAGLTDAFYKKATGPTAIPAINSTNKRKIFTPDATSMLSAQYEYNIKTGYRIIVRGEWKYIGKQYFDLENTLEQQPYHLFNSKVGLTTNHFDLFIWASNLSKRNYIDYAYDFGAAHLGAPRIYGLSFNKNF